MYTDDQIRQYVDQLIAGGATYGEVAQFANRYGVPLNDVYGAYGMTPDQGSALLNPPIIGGNQSIPPNGGQDFGLKATLSTGPTNPATNALSTSGPTVPGPSYGNGPLSNSQVDEARAWINQQYGGATPWQFNGDFGGGLTDSNMQALGYGGGMYGDILGATQAMGYDNDALAQILGYSPEQIDLFQNSYFGDQYSNEGYRNNAVDNASLQFALDQGWITQDDLANYKSDNGSRFGYTGGADGGFNEAMRTQFGTVKYQYGTDANGNPVMLPDQGGGGGGGGFGGGGPGIRNGNKNIPGSGGSTTPLTPGGIPVGAPQFNAPQLNTQYQVSPFLQDQISQIGDQISSQFNEQILPGIRSNSIATGGYGGSNQGIAEGRAAGDAATAFTNASTNLLAGDYTNWMNRELQKYGMDQSYGLGMLNSDRNYTLGQGSLANQKYGIDKQYDLGMGNLGLGYYNAGNNFALGQGQLDLGNQNSWMNFYNTNRAQDTNDALAGSNIYNTMTQASWYPYIAASGIYNNAAGNNTTTSNNNSAGGGWGGAIGGLLAGGQLGKNFGWW